MEPVAPSFAHLSALGFASWYGFAGIVGLRMKQLHEIAIGGSVAAAKKGKLAGKRGEANVQQISPGR